MKPSVCIILSLLLLSCETRRAELFNGHDLQGWDTYLGPAYDTATESFDSLPGAGLNNDPSQVFTVVMEDGQPAIRISGEHFGAISTQGEFGNYHLSLEFKWGQVKWAPKLNSKRDSGLLYHSNGPYGADGGFWMRSQEFQIQESDCGDYWGVAGGTFDIPAEKRGEEFVYSPQAPLVTFSEGSGAGRHAIKFPDSERKTGEWNTIDLYCLGDTAVHIVNGKVNMVLFRSRQMVDGQEAALKSGRIQLQSEGAEVFYRQVRLEPITSLPKEILP